MLAAAASVGTVSAGAAPPAYDHIVIVIEENHNDSQVIGNGTAPYINNTLAAEGQIFSHMHGITHPSQPNYLQLFSGDNQGRTTNATSPTQFVTPNLGAALIGAGKTFAGYSETLPGEGSLVDNAGGNDGYYRKHNPWSNWQVPVPAANSNQLAPSTNKPFTAFPTNFSLLPTVAIVVPNQANDMHNGTIAQADTWLSGNINNYYQWAKTNNSLLIVTWDEDASTAGNNNTIPTIFAGSGVQPGSNDSTWTLHNLLRTVEDTYGTAHSGSAEKVRSIHGAFVGDAPATTLRFQQNVNGYASAKDTQLRQDAAGTPFNTTTKLVVDGDDNVASGLQPVHALIRFDNIFGNAAGQVPAGAIIQSAKLLIPTGSTSNSDESATAIELHRMKVGWNDTDTWNTFGGDGITLGTDAETASEFTLLANVANASAIFDVSDTIQDWLANPSANHGWAFIPTGTDDWRWNSSEFATASLRPQLEIVYSVPEPSAALLLFGAGLGAMVRRRRVAGR